ncbi:MAG: hypothetical protein H6585_10945 [Flavobacteriales bacterium]|nr:hypothetical protein [Flavobacteriales bacterium]MCB9448850.1 hypothetical protein [Flavobacteriales bacterium]
MKHSGRSILFSFYFLVSFFGLAHADDSTDVKVSTPIEFKPEVSLQVGMMRFFGDVGYDQLNEPYKTRPGYQIDVRQSLKPNLQVGLFLHTGKLAASEKSLTRNMNFQTNIQAGGVQCFYDFAPLLKDRSILTPFLNVGIGFMHFRPKGDLYDASNQLYYYWNDGSIRSIAEDDPKASSAVVLQKDHVYETDLRDANMDGFGNYPLTSLIFPIGGGVSFNINEQINFKLGTNLHYTMTDFIDNVTQDGTDDRKGRGGNDRYMFTYMGFSYNFNPRKTAEDYYYEGVDFYALQVEDHDMDGVQDASDLCPETPEGEAVNENGCPLDDDNDGVPNYRDNQAGTLTDTLVDTRGELMTPEMILNIYMEYIDSTGRFGFDPSKHKQSPTEEYRIMVGAFDEGIPNEMMDAFLSIEDLKSMKDENGRTILTVGSFATAEEAEVKRRVLEEGGMENTKVVRWLPEFSQNVNIDLDKVDHMVNTGKGDHTPLNFERVLYRVQLGAFRSEISVDNFKGINDLNSLKTNDGFYKYMSGTFYAYSEAVKHRIDMLVKGFEGAFVVAYKDGKQLNIVDAIEAEKKYNEQHKDQPEKTSPGVNKPSGMDAEEDAVDGDEQPAQQTSPDQENEPDNDGEEQIEPDHNDSSAAASEDNPFESDPTLAEKSGHDISFRVQLGNFNSGDIPEADLLKINNLKDVQKQEGLMDGQTTYSSPSFNTYKEANAYLGYAMENGIDTAALLPYRSGVLISLNEAATSLKEN